MTYTMVPILSEDPFTLAADHLPLDGAEGEAFKKALQGVHPRLLQSLKESALLSEEDSEFCVAGGVFEYERGEELVIDGAQLSLSHCAVHFVDALLTPAQCLEIAEEKREALAAALANEEQQRMFDQLCAWWRQGWRVLLLQHM